jgi:hypothetical protein
VFSANPKQKTGNVVSQSFNSHEQREGKRNATDMRLKLRHSLTTPLTLMRVFNELVGFKDV